MRKGKDFGWNVRQLMFRIMKFVERAKTDPVISVFNTNDRLEAMLSISRSIFKLRSEMYGSVMNDDQNQDDNRNEDKIQLRSQALFETPTVLKGVRRKNRK